MTRFAFTDPEVRRISTELDSTFRRMVAIEARCRLSILTTREADHEVARHHLSTQPAAGPSPMVPAAPAITMRSILEGIRRAPL